jgi:hypothetical protein
MPRARPAEAIVSDANPYKSPIASSENAVAGGAARSPRWPAVFSAVLILIGGCFLSLLNGQVFTNTLVFISCTALSATLWIPFATRSKERQRRLVGCLIIFGHLALIALFATNLPEKYRWQQRFQQRGK